MVHVGLNDGTFGTHAIRSESGPQCDRHSHNQLMCLQRSAAPSRLMPTGVCDGIGYGFNTKSAIVRLGAVEISKFAVRFFPQQARSMCASVLDHLCASQQPGPHGHKGM